MTQTYTKPSGTRYSGVEVRGNCNILATTREVQGSVYENIKIIGDNSMLGDHDADVVKAHISNNAPKKNKPKRGRNHVRRPQKVHTIALKEEIQDSQSETAMKPTHHAYGAGTNGEGRSPEVSE